MDKESLIMSLNSAFKNDNTGLPDAVMTDSKYDDATNTLYCHKVVNERDKMQDALRYFSNSYNSLLASVQRGGSDVANDMLRAEYCKIAKDTIQFVINSQKKKLA